MRIRKGVCLVCFFASALQIWALPSQPSAVFGSAEFEQIDSSQLKIQVSERALIHWGEFSVLEGELVEFCQPSKASCLLNRVTGFESSKLLGRLTANGEVYLINPHGIVIGPHAQISTEKFIASGLDCLDEDFIAGRQLCFFGEEGEILQEGTIQTVGDVCLIGSKIQQKGVIQTEAGGVYLATGNRLFVKLDDCEIERDLKVLEHPYALSICHSGSIEASRGHKVDGRIFLIADRGVEVSGSMVAEQGEIRLLGQSIDIQPGAAIDVSSLGHGGSILVGGDYRGGNFKIANASRVSIAPDVVLRADGQEMGDGGKVIVWSDGVTQCYGTVFARGGKAGGNGGFIEISGKEHLHFEGHADTSSPLGKTGDLLLDPNDFVISGNYSNIAASLRPFNDKSFKATTAGTSILSIAALQSALSSNNVIIDTSSPFDGNGDIVFNGDVTWHTAFNLTCLANRNVTVNGVIQNTLRTPDISGGGILISAPGDLILDASSAGAPCALFTDLGEINVNIGGDLSLIGGDLASAAATIASTSGDINIATAGGIRLHGGAAAETSAQILSQSGNMAFDIGGDLSLTGGAVMNVSALIQAIAGDLAFPSIGGNVSLMGGTATDASAQIQNVLGTLTMTNIAGEIQLVSGMGAFSHVCIGGPGTIDPTGPVYIASEGDIILKGNPLAGPNSVAVLGDSRTFTSVATKGDIHILGGSADKLAFIRSRSGPLEINVAGDLNLIGGSDANGGDAAIKGSGDWPVEKMAIHVGGDLNIFSGSGTSGCNASIDAICGPIFVTVGKNLNMGSSSVHNVTGAARFYTEDTSLDLQVQGNIVMSGTSAIELFLNAGGRNGMTIQAGKEILLSDSAQIFVNQFSSSPVGDITLIADALFPKPPNIGSGSFHLGENALIDTLGGRLRIFTAERSSNSIKGSLNGLTFVPGREFINTDLEMWGTYYPHFSGVPYTLFYKNIDLPDTLYADYTIAAYEFLKWIEGYDRCLYIPETPYVLFLDHSIEYYDMLRKTYKEMNGKIRTLVQGTPL